MAFSDIKKAILDEAQKEAEKCKAQGSKEVEEITAAWEQRALEKKQALLSAFNKRAEQKLLQAKFQIQHEIQSQVLRKKQQILDQVYETALEKLVNLDKDQYIELMVKIIQKLPQEPANLISVSQKKDLLDKALKQSGCKHKLSSDSITGTGGFIFQSSQTEIDCTFESLLQETRKETISAVAGTIFNNQA